MKHPVSFSKPNVVGWMVAESGFTGKQKTMAERCSELSYEWAAMRAGQLNPEQKKQQAEACRKYVEQIMRQEAAGFVGLSALLWWLLPKVLGVIINMLIDYLNRDEETSQEWSQYVAQSKQG